MQISTIGNVQNTKFDTTIANYGGVFLLEIIIIGFIVLIMSAIFIGRRTEMCSSHNQLTNHKIYDI